MPTRAAPDQDRPARAPRGRSAAKRKGPRDIARGTPGNQRLINHLGRDIPVRIQRNRQARHMTLRIDAREACAVLTLPNWVSIAEGMAFGRSKADWVLRQLDLLAPHTPFADGRTVPYHGRDILISHFPLAGPDPVLSGDVLHVPGNLAGIGMMVRDWLMEEARRALAVRVAVKAAMIRRDPPPFRLTDPRARWGSCSSEGRLCFSWRLVMAPIEVLDYVVAHEVGHLLALDHSPRFHAIVERLTAHSDFARDWLDSEGARLLRYG